MEKTVWGDSVFMKTMAFFWILVIIAFAAGFVIDRRDKRNKRRKSREHYDSVNENMFSSGFRIKAPEVPAKEPAIPYSPDPDLSKNTGYDYEVFCASILKDNDFTDIEVTPKSGDFGADIVATDEYGDVWVFQCKYYKSKVSNNAVQEVVTSMAHYGAVRAGIITSSTLTESARILAKENNVMVCEKIGRNVDFSLIKDELVYK